MKAPLALHMKVSSKTSMPLPWEKKEVVGGGKGAANHEMF
jgi:hypothetical protein